MATIMITEIKGGIVKTQQEFTTTTSIDNTNSIKMEVAARVEIIVDGIDECWNSDIYEENCPPGEYDYEANGEEKAEDIDPDSELYQDTQMTIREKMAKMVTDAFKLGWEKMHTQG
jgi:hypothetical protein